jgi:trehalose 6-phosphate synthase
VPRRNASLANRRGPGELTDQTFVVVSNRGPLSFSVDDAGEVSAARAGGGLAAALGPALAGTGATWIAGAVSDADREVASDELVEAGGFRLRMLDVAAADYRGYYDVIANSTLWYLYHGLFDRPRRPRIDRYWREAWSAYRRVNAAFATAVAEESPEGSIVLVQDYHLSLLGGHVARERPDLRAVHFHHTPFCRPEELRILPDEVAEELMSALASFDACGFQARRWADAFEACCTDVVGSAPATFVSPATPDAAGLGAVAASPECARALARIEERVGDCKLIVRVDRIELSKNLLRGFHALDDLLRTYPEWRERVVFGAFVYPSRELLADYLAYRAEVEALAERINVAWSTGSWAPILLDLTDDYPASVAALRRYDVLLVNPVRDGLNLVAKEGPLVNERDGVLALSRESGVWDELQRWALEINPFDVSGTADVLHAALRMDAGERAERVSGLRQAAARRSARDWLADQLRTT